MKIYLVIDGDYGVIQGFTNKQVAKTWIEKSTFRYGATIQEIVVCSAFLPMDITKMPKPYHYNPAIITFLETP